MRPRDEEPTDYRTQPPREPEPVFAPALSATRAAPRVELKQLAIFALVLPVVFLFGRSWLREAQSGELRCDRASRRCEIDNGWWIRDRTQFPLDELRGAKVTWSRSSHLYLDSTKIYWVHVVTAGGPHVVGGSTRDATAKSAAAARVNAFVKTSSAPSLEVQVARDTFKYVIVWMLGLIYGFVAVGFIVGWLRGRKTRAA